MALPAKPLLRGVLHQWAFVAAIAAGAVLVALADDGRARLAATIYAVGLAAMFGASALYHRPAWRSPRVVGVLRRLDHSMIFVFIAASYTPFALLAFEGTWATGLLIAVWIGAVVGLVLNLSFIHAPRWLGALVYLALGWAGVLALPRMFSDVGVAWAVLVIVGGGLYTLGAVTYALQRPDPVPHVFGFHELFHALVIAAATLQFIAITAVVATA